MNKQEWKKIVYNETPDNVNVIQGFIEDKGDFIEIKGDFKTVEVNKSKIVSITSKKEVFENDINT
jgi:hypothetical protein